MRYTITLYAVAILLMTTSCGTFGEAFMAAMSEYNTYGNSAGSAYSTGGNVYSTGGNMDYLLNPYYAAAQTTANGGYSTGSSTSSQYSSSSSYSSGSSSSSSYSSSSRSKDCSSLKVNQGKWYCANTGKCGMCGGDGLMDGSFGLGANNLKCTLCNGSGKCKYCR